MIIHQRNIGSASSEIDRIPGRRSRRRLDEPNPCARTIETIVGFSIAIKDNDHPGLYLNLNRRGSICSCAIPELTIVIVSPCVERAIGLDKKSLTIKNWNESGFYFAAITSRPR